MSATLAPPMSSVVVERHQAVNKVRGTHTYMGSTLGASCIQNDVVQGQNASSSGKRTRSFFSKRSATLQRCATRSIPLAAARCSGRSPGSQASRAACRRSRSCSSPDRVPGDPEVRACFTLHGPCVPGQDEAVFTHRYICRNWLQICAIKHCVHKWSYFAACTVLQVVFLQVFAGKNRVQHQQAPRLGAFPRWCLPNRDASHEALSAKQASLCGRHPLSHSADT